MSQEWQKHRDLYEEIFLIDRKKLKKECKRKKDKSLKKILFQMEKEQRKNKAKNSKKFESQDGLENEKKKRKRGKKKKGSMNSLGQKKEKFTSKDSNSGPSKFSSKDQIKNYQEPNNRARPQFDSPYGSKNQPKMYGPRNPE